MRTLTLLLAGAAWAMAADATFVLQTTRLAPYTRAYLGNGFMSLSTTPLGTAPAESFMTGLYDHAAGDVPHLALLPAWNEFDIESGGVWLNQAAPDASAIRQYRQTLDMYDGTLRTEYEWGPPGHALHMQIESFVSRADEHLGASEVTVVPEFSGPVEVRLALRAWPAPKRYALSELKTLTGPPEHDQWAMWYGGHMVPHEQDTRMEPGGALVEMLAQPEGGSQTVAEAVAVDWPGDLPALHAVNESVKGLSTVSVSFRAEQGRRYVFHKYAAIELSGGLENAAALAGRSRQRGYEVLRGEHAEAWHRLWESDILTPGDAPLQTAIHSALFYLLGSAGTDPAQSIAPMGLSTAGYNGHIFWDADTFMFPVLMALHPELAKPLIMFRSRTLGEARRNAVRNGHQGAMYPWEADEQGRESTPRFAYQNALYENHVNADVALAQWQYYLATGDRQWLEQYGYPIIHDTADFWVSRVTYNRQFDRYEIGDTVSVDESKIGVRDDPYTNAAAKKNLELAVAASRELGKPANPKWSEVAQKMYLPKKDVLLLDYPLEFSLSESQKRAILQEAEATGRQNGVMMEVEFYPILAAEMGDRAALDGLLDNSYRPYLRPPFNVLPETPTNQNINFLTGAGAFLQQFVFGYTGLRFSADAGLSRRFQPILPRSVPRLILRNISIRGRRTDIMVPGGTAGH